MISNTVKSEFSPNKLKGELTNHEKTDKIGPEKPYKVKLVWRNIIVFAYLHLGAFYGLYLMFTSAKIATTIFNFDRIKRQNNSTWILKSLFTYLCIMDIEKFLNSLSPVIMIYLSGFGITAGVHRLWSHRAYKATWQLRLFLTFCNTVAFQDSIIDWSRDHRLHHKHTETNADPYNAKRGFFFAHVGWLLSRKHPDIKEKGRGIDLSDLYADPILSFQKKYYFVLMPLCSFILPTVIPVYCWNESWMNAHYVSTILRWVYVVNATWCVNSFAHLIGNKPYEKSIYASQNLFASIVALGEGWHNYHHVFPWDYKTAELGNYSVNFTTAFIDFFAWLGWAYDLKSVPNELIKARVLRTGDGSHDVWGWGDKSATKAQLDATVITHRR